MTETILVAGTASHVGKSTVAAGLCRLLANRGYDVAPFKAQNMSNNARAVLRGPSVGAVESGSTARDADAGRPGAAAGSERTRQRDDNATTGRWGEIGVSQFVQARAARTTPTTDCNPVLLKPRGDGESQLVVDGLAVDHFAAGTYYQEHWDDAREAAETAHRRLAESADVIVAEGAGSIAEINLHERDLANVETARFADARIVLCVDIERGGAFASLYGTVELLPDDVRERVVGAIITKFRGDETLLEPGIERIERRCGVPVIGVVPYADIDLPEEDSLGLPDRTARERRGVDDGVPDDERVTVAVPRLPYLSNSADVEALAGVPGVTIEYVPVSSAGRDPLSAADAVVIPGTKNTVDDLESLRTAGFGSTLRNFDGPIVGICGGFQLLGRRLLDADLEGTGDRKSLDGIDLLPVETRFATDKRVRRREISVDGAAPIEDATGTATGYEIHAGRTTTLEPVSEPLESGSAATDGVLGTYLHGLFENAEIRSAFVDTVYRTADVGRSAAGSSATPAGNGPESDDPYEAVAALLERNVSLSAIGDWFPE